jgi:hypothetical protein
MTQGILDRMVKSAKPPEQKQRDALAYIEQLELGENR